MVVFERSLLPQGAATFDWGQTPGSWGSMGFAWVSKGLNRSAWSFCPDEWSGGIAALQVHCGVCPRPTAGSVATGTWKRELVMLISAARVKGVGSWNAHTSQARFFFARALLLLFRLISESFLYGYSFVHWQLSSSNYHVGSVLCELSRIYVVELDQKIFMCV